MSWIAFKNKIVSKTRKECQCFGCLKKIPVGSKVRYTSGKWDGESIIISTRYCERCDNFMSDPKTSFDWQDYQDGMSAGDLREHDDFKDYKN